MSSYTKAHHQKIGGGLYRIVSEQPPGMWFYVGLPTSNRGILIPNGFITDGPSLPSWLKSILWCLGILDWVTECLLKASAVHDEMRGNPEFTLIESDVYFLIAMTADQVNWKGPRLAGNILRETAFLSVRFNRSRVNRTLGPITAATS